MGAPSFVEGVLGFQSLLYLGSGAMIAFSSHRASGPMGDAVAKFPMRKVFGGTLFSLGLISAALYAGPRPVDKKMLGIFSLYSLWVGLTSLTDGEVSKAVQGDKSDGIMHLVLGLLCAKS